MQSTNQQLYAYHIEARQMQRTFTGFLLGSRIRDFYKNNKTRLDTLFAKMDGLQKKYFVMEDGKTKEIKDENGEVKPVVLEGKTFEEFQAELKQLMDIEINIIG